MGYGEESANGVRKGCRVPREMPKPKRLGILTSFFYYYY